jgi:transposase
MRKKDARSFSAETQEAIRCRAVECVRSGMSQTEVARRFSVARGTVAGWMKRFREGGRRALAKRKQGRPKGSRKLKGWQAAVIVRMITDRTPDQLKMPFVLWTREAVRDLIATKFQVTVSLMTVGRWLKRWGFTPQKPVRRARERDPEAVARWLQTEYPQIRREAKREGAEIHWGDEMGLRSDHQTGRSFSRKGHTPAIAGTGQRFGCNMISTVTNRGTLRFMVFTHRFNAKVLVAFLERLIKSVRRKVYLIVDGHPAHKAIKVKKWLRTHAAEIRLFFLPAYSPDLNPDEMLNNDVKANAVGRRRPRNRQEMMADVRGYLRSTQKHPEIVKSYFHAPSVRYAME